MIEPLLVWLVFFLLAAVIVFAGLKLSRYGDMIAEKTGLGRTWIGVLLLAFVTSLPELATSTAAAALSLPDIVFGNVFGSNLFNLVIIGFLDFITRRSPALHLASRNHLITASYGVMMMGLALVPLILYYVPGLGIEPIRLFGLVDVSSLLLIALYITGMRQLFIREREDSRVETTQAIPKKYLAVPRIRAYASFAIYAAMIIGAGIGMSYTAEIIANFRIEIFGQSRAIGQTMVGIVLMAMATSLPELVVSIGAARLGAIDMAVGNVLGSNMFNILIIGIADFFYAGGSILGRPTVTGAAVDTGFASHMVTGMGGIFLTAVVAAVIARRVKSDRRMSWSTPLLFVIFLAIYFLLFQINFH